MLIGDFDRLNLTDFYGSCKLDKVGLKNKKNGILSNAASWSQKVILAMIFNSSSLLLEIYLATNTKSLSFSLEPNSPVRGSVFNRCMYG